METFFYHGCHSFSWGSRGCNATAMSQGRVAASHEKSREEMGSPKMIMFMLKSFVWMRFE